MTRRIAVGVTLLVAALLIGVALPLVLTTASADRQQFRAGALSSARMTAAAAEEQLADPTDQPGGGRPHLLAAPGDRVVVLARTGRRVAAAGDPAPRPPAALLRGALAGRSGTAWRGVDDGRRLLVAVPVGAADRLHGAVVLDRPAASLDSQLERLYARAGTAAAAAVLLAVTLGALLVRWLTKPIVTLERAALDLGNGHLDRRAPVRGGPPELRRLATAFNAMAGRLHTLLDAHRTVIADVSHQLRPAAPSCAQLRPAAPSCAHPWQPFGCVWSCLRTTPNRPSPQTSPTRWPSWPGSPGSSTACSRSPAPRTRPYRGRRPASPTSLAAASTPGHRSPPSGPSTSPRAYPNRWSPPPPPDTSNRSSTT